MKYVVKSFQYKLLIYFSISVILPIMLLSVSIAGIFQQKISNERLEYSSSALYSISTNLSTYASDLKRIALTPYTFEELMDFYYMVENGKYMEQADSYEVYMQRYQYIQAMQKLLFTSREDILSISFMPADPQQNLLLSTTRSKELLEITDYDYHRQAWYRAAMAGKGDMIYSMASSLPYLDEGFTVFSVIHKVRNVYTKRDIGVIRIDASDRLIQDIFSHVKISKNSAFMLIDEDGSIIYKTGTIDTSGISALELDDLEYRSDRDVWDLYQEPIDELSWKLVYFSSRGDAWQQTMVIWVMVVFLSLASIATALCIFKRNARRTSDSLHVILDAMERVSKGSLDEPVQIEDVKRDYFSNQEFSLIASHINDMMDQLNRHIEKEFTYEIRRQQAEYRALQSQINPHFLYNTLNSFVTMNRIGMKQELEDSIIFLTKMFRYTCSNSEMALVKDEFDFCYQYIMLQKMRYEDKLTFVQSMAPETGQMVLPRLILQPLVENAIKHGMGDGERDITIWVESSVEQMMADQTVLNLTVRNNGTPIDLNYVGQAECVGLKNIQSRLEIFHKNAKMEIYVTKENMTEIILRIPIG